jgi:phage tail sheath protein FI
VPAVLTTKQLTAALSSAVPAFTQMFQLMAASQNTLPPSSAMAGIYTANDAAYGVWNAPANVGIAGAIAPLFPISDRQQEDLNAPINGMAINAIRTFVNRGTLVWGARTLDATSNDWKYIQVRRTMIFIEQSVKDALERFVFAPNTAQTWVTVVAMIESFLHGVWAAGGLMGNSAAQAYNVQCGLGSTMTSDDILAGNMNVTIVLTMVHPAEFIELTFKQQMIGGA